jgi:hypothetical protein
LVLKTFFEKKFEKRFQVKITQLKNENKIKKKQNNATVKKKYKNLILLISSHSAFSS